MRWTLDCKKQVAFHEGKRKAEIPLVQLLGGASLRELDLGKIINYQT